MRLRVGAPVRLAPRATGGASGRVHTRRGTGRRASIAAIRPGIAVDVVGRSPVIAGAAWYASSATNRVAAATGGAAGGAIGGATRSSDPAVCSSGHAGTAA